MTEEEWRKELGDAQSMIRYLLVAGNFQRTKRGKRKLRLYACGCCRVIWSELSRDDRSGVYLAEQVADSAISRDQMNAALRANPRTILGGNLITFQATAAQFPSFCTNWTATDCALDASSWHFPIGVLFENSKDADATQCDLVRDIFGNPFRPVAFDPEWRTSNVVALARSMYESRDFSLMPILGDALQDAGCEHADVLDHCRGPGPHVKGCWVVDLVLGKE